MDHSGYKPPNTLDSTSTTLLRRVAANDGESWRQFVSLYGPVVRYWIRRAGLQDADLADVFSEVFFAVSRNIAGFGRETGVAKFRAWLKTITLNKVQDHFRRQGKLPAVGYGGSSALMRLHGVEAATLVLEDDADAALAHSEDAFLAHRTLQIVKKEFTEQSWNAFYRTAIDGLTSQEVAAELGISALAVRKAKSRIMRRLKESLSGNLPPK